MRTSKKRKLVGPVKSINIVVTADARTMLDELAGSKTLGETVERLISREHNKRMRKHLQVRNNSFAI